MKLTRLTPELARLQEEIEGYAASYGLDFFPVNFELLDWYELNAVASYHGIPSRYPHWRFGMEYDRLAKGSTYGLQRIYELVINNDPAYAYLMRSNSIVDQKLVMAHVYGHVDFFKNNMWFSKTNRKMVDEMANHGTRIRRSIDRYGLEPVENFLDVCLSIEDLVDPHAPFIRRRKKKTGKYRLSNAPETRAEEGVHRFPGKEYMAKFLNPPEYLQAQRAKLEEEKKREKRFPESPEKDILLFLIENAPLEHWQADILSIVREESYYFVPQRQTKIMNEGWASFWHSTLMTQKLLKDSEVIDYADHHSGTMGAQPGTLNPYKVGLELLRDIEERWNTGRFGKEYDECDSLEEKRRWNKDLGLGRQKIFEVRRIYNDVSFIETFLTEEFCKKHKLFVYAYNQRTRQYEIDSRDFEAIKKQLLFFLTHFGRPRIEVVDGNFRNRGELFLRHVHEGVDLEVPAARDTLQNVQRIWNRPVHLETAVDGQGKIFSFDGSEHKETEAEG
ncbi:MAG: SpoVR family protein [Planctomycetes bacterium]|nr:SpoVR family protein [Planctomycetota bacterium]